jgi:hypothetical protein
MQIASFCVGLVVDKELVVNAFLLADSVLARPRPAVWSENSFTLALPEVARGAVGQWRCGGRSAGDGGVGGSSGCDGGVGSGGSCDTVEQPLVSNKLYVASQRWNFSKSVTEKWTRRSERKKHAAHCRRAKLCTRVDIKDIRPSIDPRIIV